MADMRLIRDMSAALNAKPKQPQPYDTTAEVVRVDGSTAWVHIPGGVDETPVQMSVNARIGDTVRVRVGGGTAWLVGNDTAPPTDDKKANEAQAKVDEVADYVSTHMELTDDGLQISADGNQWKVIVKNDGVYVVDPSGRYASQFSSYAQLGVSDGSHSIIDENGQRFYGSDGTTQLANIGYGEGASESGTAVAPYYTFGTRAEGVVGNYSFAAGYGVLATKKYSYAEGNETEATGTYSHAEGRRSKASGFVSHAEGYNSSASGEGSHAEGIGATAEGKYSHAENSSDAYGNRSHSENVGEAYGEGSHAENSGIARGDYSHAQGYGTDASSDYQTALGKFNVVDDADTYAVIIGNGTAATRSNALAVKWNGDVVLPANATVDGVDVSELDNDVDNINMSSTSSVSSGSNTTLCNTGSLSAGTYILNATAFFPSASGGYRKLFFATSDSGNPATRFARTTVAPVSGDDTEVQLTTLVTISSATTYYLRAYQNSGSSMSIATAGIQVLKIHA